MFIAVFTLSVLLRMECWTGSAVAHTLSSHKDPAVTRYMWNLDATGVFTSLMGIANVGTYCELQPKTDPWIWLASLSVGSTICLVCAILFGCTKQFSVPGKYRSAKGVCFGTALIIYSIPFAWKCVVYGLESYSWMLWCVVLSAAAAGFFFVTFLPEKYFNTWFTDVWLNSHASWHWGNFAADIFFYNFCHHAAFATQIL